MNASFQKGFGLIEILITLAVITFGIVAHLIFQRVTFHEAGLAVSRARAAEIAQEKLEDLRAFGCIKAGACTFAFEDIASDVGGNKNSGGQLMQQAATAFTVDNNAFTRHWTVIDYWYNATNSAPTAIAPASNPPPDVKAVTVKVSWTDSNGTQQTLNLSSQIAGVSPADQARVFQ